MHRGETQKLALLLQVGLMLVIILLLSRVDHLQDQLQMLKELKRRFLKLLQNRAIRLALI